MNFTETPLPGGELTDDQLIFDACYIWTLSILKQLKTARLITAAELERIRKLSEQHYQPSLLSYEICCVC